LNARTIWLETAYLPDGWHDGLRLEIDAKGDILSISKGAPEPTDERVSGAVLPGMPNLHSHAFQRAQAGLTEHRHSKSGDSFWTWRQVMHGFVTRFGPEECEAVAAQLYVEMLKAGYTAVGEFHYLHLDPAGAAYADRLEMSRRLLAAAEHAGIGLTLLPVLYSVGGYGGIEPNPGQRRYILDVEAFLAMIQALKETTAGNPQVRIGIAPHSVRQVPPESLAAAVTGAREIDAELPIHIHMAEQVRDVDDHLSHFGARPVAWLLDNAPVDAHWCLVHATHLDAQETRDLAASGAIAGLCPTTEGNLGDGLFPLSDYLDAGGRWGIGSDSHVSVSVTEELRWLEYGQRLKTLSRNVGAPGQGGSTGTRLFADALAGGAQALGRHTGTLAPGFRADLVVLDPDHPVLFGRRGERLLDSWIFSGNETSIRHVMVGGRWRVRDGRHADEEAIAERYRRAIETLGTV